MLRNRPSMRGRILTVTGMFLVLLWIAASGVLVSQAAAPTPGFAGLPVEGIEAKGPQSLSIEKQELKKMRTTSASAPLIALTPTATTICGNQQWTAVAVPTPTNLTTSLQKVAGLSA